MSKEDLKLHAIVELFGHTRMAGLVTEQTIGSSTFIRIDVPDTGAMPSFTRMINPSAIYAINPVTEEVMLHMAKSFQSKPIEIWDIREMQKRLLALKQANNGSDSGSNNMDEEDDLPEGF